MKFPFSYRTQPFRPVLLASFVGHVLFLGASGFLFSLPRFAVEQAPGSVEVVILEEKPVKEKVVEEEVKITLDPAAREKIFQKKKQKPKEEVAKPLYSPPVKGALEEAEPDYLKNPAPVYPQIARDMGWQGVVVLKVLVERDGKAAQVEVERSSGHQMLDESAVKAVKEWQFLPARVGSLTFSSWVKIPVRFILVEE
jgi:protein TonB